MALDSLVAILLVAGCIMLVPRRPAVSKPVKTIVFGLLAILLGRYIWWRLTQTVLPADPLTIEGAFIWALFVIEILAWCDAILLSTFLGKRTDRSGEADQHEANLRAMPAAKMPAVDIFIATYNEPLEVLERTIIGTKAIDWPEDKLAIWILDDGRRPWLEAYAKALGVGYMTRKNNAHAKAGNINTAIAKTDAPFILVLDADFVPQTSFLMRTMGFFEDPGIGIVQVPHSFFNPDPVQSSLNMSKVMPDDQRFFFEAIMPGRDGYDCAFCCGSNGIIRRAAIEEIGGGLPTGSITEDMLLSIALKRRGYTTRYLNERLAFGLAPESINAFFIQRARWARGGIQILFLSDGPLGGGGMRWYERIFFLPTHWLTQSLAQVAAISTPVVYLMTGLRPMLNTDLDTIVSYQLPTIIATIAAVRLFASDQYHPLASMAQSVLQAFRLLPVVLATLLKPHGHAFKVTPKGGEGTAVRDDTTFWICIGLVAATTLGFMLNAFPVTQIVVFSHLVPVVAFWATLNMVVLLLVAKISVTPPAQRKDERFVYEEPLELQTEHGAYSVQGIDISMGGVSFSANAPLALETEDWVCLTIPSVGEIPARVRRTSRERLIFGVSFCLPDASAPTRDDIDSSDSLFLRNVALRHRLVEELFTTGRANSTVTNGDGTRILMSMLREIIADDRAIGHNEKSNPATSAMDRFPSWLEALLVASDHAPPTRKRANVA